MTDPRHARLLLDVLSPRVCEAADGFRASWFDVDRFVAVCVESDVAAWVHATLADGGRATSVGAEAARDALAPIRAKVRRDVMLLLARAEQALAVLAAEGVTPVALKGLDWIHRTYSGIDLRTLDDVDLLVRTEELGRAVRALERAGWRTPPEPQRSHYVRSSHHLPMRAPGPIPVEFEVHWNIAQAGRYRIEPADLFARAVPLEIGEHRLLRLDDRDGVAHLLLHHFSHYFDRRTKWALDLRRLAEQPGFSWADVVGRVHDWGAVAACGMAVRHLRKLFPDSIPAEVAEDLPVGRWRRGATAPLRSTHPLELFRGTRRRAVQLWLAAVMLESPAQLPGWLLHRARRDRTAGANPLDSGGVATEE